jgi:hypothetical protein
MDMSSKHRKIDGSNDIIRIILIAKDHLKEQEQCTLPLIEKAHRSPHLDLSRDSLKYQSERLNLRAGSILQRSKAKATSQFTPVDEVKSPQIPIAAKESEKTTGK